MSPEERTYMLLKYGGEEAIIDRYCKLRSDQLSTEEDLLLTEYVGWYISEAHDAERYGIDPDTKIR